MVGILGILKAGGAYVPLDAVSAQRLEFMLHDSVVAHLVTQRHLLPRLSVTLEHSVLLYSDEPAFAEHAASNPQSKVGPQHLAYTMYTSGSTGEPKGVQILHSAVVNLFTAMADQPGLSHEDWLLSVSATFDISVLELLLPLTVRAGLRWCLPMSPPTPGPGSPSVDLRAATVVQATPATWQMLIQNGWNGGRRLKVISGGETMTDSLAKELRERCAEVWNLYGPTETTIYSTRDPK